MCVCVCVCAVHRAGWVGYVLFFPQSCCTASCCLCFDARQTDCSIGSIGPGGAPWLRGGADRTAVAVFLPDLQSSLYRHLSAALVVLIGLLMSITGTLVLMSVEHMPDIPSRCVCPVCVHHRHTGAGASGALHQHPIQVSPAGWLPRSCSCTVQRPLWWPISTQNRKLAAHYEDPCGLPTHNMKVQLRSTKQKEMNA